jgi:hypothetical protein
LCLLLSFELRHEAYYQTRGKNRKESPPHSIPPHTTDDAWYRESERERERKREGGRER